MPDEANATQDGATTAPGSERIRKKRRGGLLGHADAFWAHSQNRNASYLVLNNLLNASTVLTVNENFGSTWLRPQIIAQGRRLQLGGQIDF